MPGSDHARGTLVRIAGLTMLIAIGGAGVGARVAPADQPARSASKPAAQEPLRLRLLAYNIHHGEGNDGVLDLERIAALIRAHDPHLVALQEVDRGVARTGGADQAQRLGELTGMAPLFGPFMDYQGGEYGMAVLSRLPVVASTNHRLPAGPEPRTSLAVQVLLPDGRGSLVFAGVHFYRSDEERLAQAETLLAALDGAGPVILAGDFNSTPDSAVMAYIGDSFTIPAKGEDRLTFRSDRPEREIDFIVYRPAERFTVVASRVLDEPVASDHRPVLLVVEVR